MFVQFYERFGDVEFECYMVASIYADSIVDRVYCAMFSVQFSSFRRQSYRANFDIYHLQGSYPHNNVSGFICLNIKVRKKNIPHSKIIKSTPNHHALHISPILWHLSYIRDTDQ